MYVKKKRKRKKNNRRWILTCFQNSHRSLKNTIKTMLASRHIAISSKAYAVEQTWKSVDIAKRTKVHTKKKINKYNVLKSGRPSERDSPWRRCTQFIVRTLYDAIHSTLVVWKYRVERAPLPVNYLLKIVE